MYVHIRACLWDCKKEFALGGEGEEVIECLCPLSLKSLIIILKTEASISKTFLRLWQEGKSGLASRASSREEIYYLIFIGHWCLLW